MFKSLFVSAWRNLTKNKVFSLINIAGLSLGMAGCLFLLQYVSFEFSFDRFHTNAATIYHIIDDRFANGKMIEHSAVTYSAIGKAMQQDFPDVVDHARMVHYRGQVITANGKQIPDESGFAVDHSFLSMFSFPLVAGDRNTALREGNTIVISETLANKLFDSRDSRDIVGKTLQISRDSIPYKIMGVMKDVPHNSSLQFSYLVSYPTIVRLWGMQDYGFNFPDSYHFIQLRKGADPKELEAKFPAFSRRHLAGVMASGIEDKFYLQPMLKSHLYSDFQYEIGDTGSATVVWSLLIIAVLIIVMAWINYINLTTGRSIERAKEVGVRKISGASRRQLIAQFLLESFLINMIALGIALLLVILVQDKFNTLINARLSLWNIFELGLAGYSIPAALGILIAVGIFLSGTYPALVLSSFNPISVLKGRFISSNKGLFLRKALVVGQFAVTIALCFGSVVVYRQIRFMQGKQLGMNIDQVLIVKPPKQTNIDSSFVSRENSFKNEVKKIAHVKDAATSWRIAGDDLLRDLEVERTESKQSPHFVICRNGISSEYLDTYQIHLLAGRAFTPVDYSPNPEKISPKIILNNTAARQLGFQSPAAAIGQEIVNTKGRMTIVGVVADYHQRSLHHAIDPLALIPSYTNWSPISIRMDVKDVTTAINEIKARYESFFPGNPFGFYFLDEKFNAQYNSDRLFSLLFAIFSSFAIFIACLGLLGLTLLTISQRIKEIGIRKVLGASVFDIVRLLTSDFIGLILLSFVISSPIAWWVMNNWLQDFAYRIQIRGWFFLSAGMLSVTLGLVMIGFHATRAALMKPVKNLRIE